MDIFSSFLKNCKIVTKVKQCIGEKTQILNLFQNKCHKTGTVYNLVDNRAILLSHPSSQRER